MGLDAFLTVQTRTENNPAVGDIDFTECLVFDKRVVSNTIVSSISLREDEHIKVVSEQYFRKFDGLHYFAYQEWQAYQENNSDFTVTIQADSSEHFNNVYTPIDRQRLKAWLEEVKAGAVDLGEVAEDVLFGEDGWVAHIQEVLDTAEKTNGMIVYVGDW